MPGMRYVHPARWPWAIGLFAAAGLAIGFAATPLQNAAAISLGRAGLGMFFAVNVLLPAAAIVVSVWYPRPRIAALGGVIVAFAFSLARLLFWNWRAWEWTPPFVAAHASPIQVAAAIGCALVGVVAALAVMPFRRVGLADQAERCRACGYLLHGLDASMCPECGRDPRAAA